MDVDGEAATTGADGDPEGPLPGRDHHPPIDAATAAVSNAPIPRSIDGMKSSPACQGTFMDCFHLLGRMEKGVTSKTDELFGVFMHMLMCAMFIMNAKDKQAVIDWLQNKRGLSAEEVARVRVRWFKTKHVRRRIPQARVLAARFAGVYEAFKSVRMADGRPFFRQESGDNNMAAIYDNCMELIINGYCSDPEDEDFRFRV
jgi:hypothetical protein